MSSRKSFVCLAPITTAFRGPQVRLRPICFISVVVAAILAMALPAFSQTPTPAEIEALVGNISTPVAAPPLWSYTVTSARDGRVYNGVAIGRSPYARGKTTTNVPTVIVPLVVSVGGVTFDPTAPVPASASACYPASWTGKTPLQLTLESPVFTAPATNWTMNGQNVGKGQYDAVFQRAEFWSLVQGSSHQTALNPVSVLPSQAVPASATAGFALTTSACATSPDHATLGSLHGGNAWDTWLSGTLIPNLEAAGNINPGQFVFFLLYNVSFSDGLGYHYYLGLQTYGVSFFNGSDCCYPDIKSISHEVADWMSDPYVNNAVPAFLSTEPPAACQNNLEVADASHTLLFPPVTMPNGVTYRPQELTYFSWFIGAPSLGAGGQYSNNNSFATDAGPVCH
jgi:hypothetical protein